MAPALFDLKKQLGFYGAYHTNHVNVAIHIIGVPTIIFGTEILLASQGSLAPKLYHLFPNLAPYFNSIATSLPSSIGKYAEFNLSTLFASFYWIYYFILDPVAASLLAPIWYSIFYFANYLVQTGGVGGYSAMQISTIAQAFGWISQFAGHGIFEGRAPALFSNLFQSVVAAPFFVFLECIFALGYRPQLQKELNNIIGQKVTEFRKAKGDKARAAKKAQ